MRKTVEVISLNRLMEAIMLSDGTYLPITNWFDEYGDECDKSEAVLCVAGMDGHSWWSVDMRGFEPKKSARWVN